MKNLNQYPTPITDEFCKDLSNSNRTDWGRWQLTASKCAELERKLAACREALVESRQCLEDVNYSEGGYILTLTRETLAATEP